MEIRFEDHPQFQRSALRAALGAAALAVVAPEWALLPAVAVGAAAGFVSGRRPALLALAALLAVAAVALARPLFFWPLPLCGALLGLGFAAARAPHARENGSPLTAGAVGATLLLTAAMLWAARLCLPSFTRALAELVPGAPLLSGALTGLWIAAACAPLHLSLQADAVEARLAALRPLLGAELRPLAERAAAARAAAAAALPQGARGDLRGLLDALALAALDLARRGADLGRTASLAMEEDLARRVEQLGRSAAAAADTAARGSYQRAAETLLGQLEHCRRVRGARERLVARLHEEVAQLERARFALTLLDGADAERSAAELDLLGDRLQHAAVACETALALNEDCEPLGRPVRA
jgi:hypothetical protein